MLRSLRTAGRSARRCIQRTERRCLGASPQGGGFTERVLVDEAGCFVAYYENWLSAATHERLFRVLRDETPWKREVDDFGEQSRSSRYMADAQCTFKYVGLELPPNPWHSDVDAVRSQANIDFRPLVERRLDGLECGPITGTGLA
jgi:hypothetical protein